MLAKKNVGQKKCWPTFFWGQQKFGPKKICVKKNIDRKKRGSNKIWVNKNLGKKKTGKNWVRGDFRTQSRVKLEKVSQVGGGGLKFYLFFCG